MSERTISFGGYKLTAPVLFASYRMGDCPTSGLRQFPWSMTRTEALLINAYDFTRRKYANWLNNGWSPEKYLRFRDKPVLIDSGAYYFRKDSSISVTTEHVLQIQLKSNADIGVVLDHPFPPDANDKAKRIATTIRNTEAMLRQLKREGNFGKITVMPAIHGHTHQSLRGCIQRLRRLADQYDPDLLKQVGIGSVAPLAQRGHATLAVEVIHYVRKALPRSQIHCFSMGSGLLMLLAFYSGADSVDSQSWMVSAGFKLAQLPGHYVVRMGKREYKSASKFEQAMLNFRNRMKQLARDEDFSAKDWSTGQCLDLNYADVRRNYVTSLIDLQSNEHVHNRACHNLWTYNFEVRQYRNALHRGTLDEFMKSRLVGTRYEAAFEHARQLRLKR